MKKKILACLLVCTLCIFLLGISSGLAQTEESILNMQSVSGEYVKENLEAILADTEVIVVGDYSFEPDNMKVNSRCADKIPSDLAAKGKNDTTFIAIIDGAYVSEDTKDEIIDLMKLGYLVYFYNVDKYQLQIEKALDVEYDKGSGETVPIPSFLGLSMDCNGIYVPIAILSTPPDKDRVDFMVLFDAFKYRNTRYMSITNSTDYDTVLAKLHNSAKADSYGFMINPLWTLKKSWYRVENDVGISGHYIIWRSGWYARYNDDDYYACLFATEVEPYNICNVGQVHIMHRVDRFDPDHHLYDYEPSYDPNTNPAVFQAGLNASTGLINFSIYAPPASLIIMCNSQIDENFCDTVYSPGFAYSFGVQNYYTTSISIDTDEDGVFKTDYRIAYDFRGIIAMGVYGFCYFTIYK